MDAARLRLGQFETAAVIERQGIIGVQLDGAAHGLQRQLVVANPLAAKAHVQEPASLGVVDGNLEPEEQEGKEEEEEDDDDDDDEQEEEKKKGRQRRSQKKKIMIMIKKKRTRRRGRRRKDTDNGEEDPNGRLRATQDNA